MPQYVVMDGCYVPVGGGLRFKTAGQTVTLDEKDAKSLKGFVEPVRGGGAQAASKGEPRDKAEAKAESKQ